MSCREYRSKTIHTRGAVLKSKVSQTSTGDKVKQEHVHVSDVWRDKRSRHYLVRDNSDKSARERELSRFALIKGRM